MYFISILICVANQCQVFQQDPMRYYRTENECNDRAREELFVIAQKIDALPSVRMAAKCFKRNGEDNAI